MESSRLARGGRRLASVLLASVVAWIAGAEPALGQASESEMRAFPMPPTQGYTHTKSFAYAGDYGYFLTPSVSQPGANAGASDYRYVRYTGVRGKDLWLYGTWGDPSAIPPPSGGADACPHAHTSYGVWARYSVLFLRFWRFIGGGGMSGMRDSSGRCVFRTNNPLAAIDPRYGWGSEALHLTPASTAYITDVVLGVLSNTHGWGTCSVAPGQFKACHEPSWAIAFTLPG
jgi:hypothetical protein